MMTKIHCFLLLSFFSIGAMAVEETSKKAGGASSVRIKAPTKVESFDSQLVEGQIYRPDLSVVTGDSNNNGFGVLRLRSNFKDRAQNERGELIK